MSKQAWVRFRLPGEKHVFSFTGEEESGITDEKISKTGYFIYSPFSLENTLYGFACKESSSIEKPVLPAYTGPLQSYTQNEYEALVDETVQRIESNHFKKVVHSRYQFFPTQVTPESIFESLQQKFPTAFVYLLYSPSLGMWCGATPEILLTSDDDHWKTMALAGTRPSQQKDEPWPEKDVEEQDIVAQRIRSTLHEAEVGFTQSQSYTKHTGAIAHICTDFWITPAQHFSMIGLAKKLHPTPAVCGFPVNEAYMRIVGVEKQTRELYAGIIGHTQTSTSGNVFVNLRCMRIFSNGVRLHAGGGINQWSQGKTEWNETVLKMNNVASSIM